ncbi:hypothetical protein ACFWP0_14460 [Achromobacter sp. NPDC058515]|uniref:hypothetical protein n=1 Tax=Achromobacter sp. NPDC058515 TaxID=3346533 RepID=UPI00364B7497
MNTHRKWVSAMSLALALVMGAASASALAQAAAAMAQAPQSLRVLDGKLKVAIPAGFIESEFPADPATPDVAGKIYVNRATRQAIIVVNMPLEPAVGDDDAFTLGNVAAGFQLQQQEAVPTFKKTGQSTFKIDGIGVSQVDATSKLDGRPALLTALFAVSGARLASFTLYTLIEEKDRHPGLVKQLTQGMSAPR